MRHHGATYFIDHLEMLDANIRPVRTKYVLALDDTIHLHFDDITQLARLRDVLNIAFGAAKEDE